MHKWEYHVAKFYNEDPAGMEHGLNRLGESGWGLVSILAETEQVPQDDATVRWSVFKRPIV